MTPLEPLNPTDWRRTACGVCGASIEWLDVVTATEDGFHLSLAAEKLDLQSVDDLEVWRCALCPAGGVFQALDPALPHPTRPVRLVESPRAALS